MDRQSSPIGHCCRYSEDDPPLLGNHHQNQTEAADSETLLWFLPGRVSLFEDKMVRCCAHTLIMIVPIVI